MSLPTTVASAILDTILGRLAALFETGAKGDMVVARDAARQMLSAYHTETEDELGLAADIISCRFQLLEALSSAAAPDLTLNKVLRLRGGAVSLSRECHKSQRKLDQRQRDRRVGVTPPQVEPALTQAAPRQPEPARPKIDNAVDLIETVREAMNTVTKTGGVSWAKSFQKRQTAKRIADNLKKNQAGHAESLYAAARPSASRSADENIGR